MMTLLKSALFFSLFTILTVPTRAQPETSPSKFFSQNQVFSPLIGDPEMPVIGLTTYSRGAYEVSLGLSKDLLAFRSNDSMLWAWGAFAGAKFLEQGDWFSFSGSQQAVDWQAGTYLSEITGRFSHKLQWTHTISYLGDGLQDGRSPITYTRDRVSLTSSFDPWDGIRFYGGLGLKLWWDDLRLGGSQSSLMFGLELHHPLAQTKNISLEGYATYQWEYKDDGPGFIDQEAQIGIRWKNMTTSPNVRLALLYYNGHSLFGQFWMEKDEHLALGLYLDL
ncbi:MAG: DUF1207 domain-containing protein [bacterium]